ncbi:hypothetical protein [Marinoscillum sp. MHG1-6]|uniref:hypothetical protein n=1 Tax=Marinoscillum sp. MHG1-6 TaxID=2959627 RepID=UPI00215778DC|nr:hypothetical protein [Marinoscillum sp. MHG1-6]
MKKLLILIAILLLGGIGYFTYNKWVQSADLTTWSFVPENAFLVYESRTPIASIEEIQQTGVWKNISSFPLFSSLTKKLDVLDTLAGEGNFKGLFNNTNTLISLHTISSSEFDFLFIAEIDNLSKHTYASKALAYFRELGFNKKTRQYLDFTVTELRKEGAESFSFIFHKNYFIGSFSAFLVEDAIRTIEYPEKQSFKIAYKELDNIAKLEKDMGNLYINYSRLRPALSALSTSAPETSFARSGFLDLKVTDKAINLSGFSFANGEDDFLSVFSQRPGPSFDMSEVIPLNTSWALLTNLSDQETFANKLTNFLAKNQPKVIEKRGELQKTYDFDPLYTFQLIDGEMGMISLEPLRPGQKDRFFIMEVKDMGEALNYFNSIGERNAMATEDSVYVETFSEYEIRKLPIPDFPYALLGDFASGFESTYYLQYRNYLIFSNNLLQLKNFTLAIQNEDVWNKSLKMKKLLDQSNQSANLSLYINTPRAFAQTSTIMKDEWAGFLKEYEFPIRNLEFMAVQFSAVDGKFYTNLAIHQPHVPTSTIPDKIDVLNSVTLTDPIISKPYLVTNHNDKTYDIVVQDSAYRVHQFANNFNPVYSVEVGEKIISGIEQIDYYKNGKLQILFATKSKIHAIDRTGTYLPGFPKAIPGNRDLTFFTLIDYDNSRNYRYALTDTKGNVYLTDKDVKALEGWAPKTFNSPLAQAPKHYRIGRKDVMAIVQQNGRINLLTRRGDSYSKFPIELDTDITSEFFVKETNDFESTSINLVTSRGEAVEISFEGSLLSREQLYKPSAQTRFSLIKDVAGEAYVINRNTERKYEMLNESGVSLFEKDYFTNEPLSIQYYRLGGGISYIILVDPGGSYLYIYDLSGKLVTGRPLAATASISLMKHDNEYQIYRVIDNNLELISLSF